MASRIGGNSDGRDGVRGVVIDCLNLRKGIQVVLLCIYRRGGQARRCVAHPYTVLNEPFVDSLGGMRHKYAAAEVGLCKNIW